MKYSILILLSIFTLVNLTYGQKLKYIELSHEIIDIPGRNFYIKNVIDSRYAKDHLGWVRKESSNKMIQANFENSLKVTLEEFFAETLPRKEGQIPITLVFKVLKVFEEKSGGKVHTYADLRVEFFYENREILIVDEKVEELGIQRLPMHEQNIREALLNCLLTFSESNWKEKIEETKKPDVTPLAITDKFENPDYAYYSAEEETEAMDQNEPKTLSEEEIQKLLPKNRNYWVVGLLVGGLGIGGVEYETRFHDRFGLNLGVSYSGYTAGIKFHFKPTMNGTFLNANFKDGGFGLMHIVGFDFGQRIGFSKKKRIGMVYQVGLGRVVRIDPAFRNYLYGNDEMPPLMLTTGVGISF